MIDKLISIKNYSKFKNFNTSISDWDGVFKKTNVIYAPNGSGKTSLAVLFNSLSGNNELVLKKKSFGTDYFPEIKFLSSRKEVKYINKKWNTFIPNIEVFDSFYMEENIYTIIVEDKVNKLNIFEYSHADEIIGIKKEISIIKKRKSKLSKNIKGIKTGIKRGRISNDERIKNILDQRITERGSCETKIKELERKRLLLTQQSRNDYITYINKYLSMFCDNMSITDIKTATSDQKQHLIYSININNYNISIEERGDLSLKYCLSEGDKNALSLSFFLARFDLLPNIKDYIVVIDDPFTSFDSQRKTTTITQLSRLAAKVSQFFLLTHDLHFANDFNNCYSNDQILNLKIAPYTYNNGNEQTSILCSHDIKFEMLNGFNKDLMTLRRFYASPKEDPLYLREVIRCIRPSIEGIFRIKYYSYAKDQEWLGDFIDKIRKCDNSSPFYRLKDYLDEIEEINDYSKQYHHSNPSYMEVDISLLELKNYVKRTLQLIEKI